jgi:hypothetical protein
MSASLTIQGLEEFRAALRRLPEALAAAAADKLEARGNSAVATIKAGYPSRSGELRNKLRVTHTRSKFGARSVVRNTSKYALPYDVGTQAARQTRGGANRGSAPANPIFSQTMARARRALRADLTEILVAEGLLVVDA